MAYKICHSIEECRAQLTALINAFKHNYSSYKKPSYSEAQLRVDFLNPLLKSFGWDVDNEAFKTQLFREVIQEESIHIQMEDGASKKNPDYTLKQFGHRVLFVEAKKVSINIIKENAPAFQIRRYGWSANLTFSILTNFEHLVFYECSVQPKTEHLASQNRYKSFHYLDFLNNLEEIYSLLSFASIKSGSLESIDVRTLKGKESFDEHFLNQIETWRETLAKNVVANNRSISQENINFQIQRIINKIIFLRICEDRDIETYQTLKQITTYQELKNLFVKSDRKYNSGIFSFLEDELAHQIIIDDQILISIFSELYYPISPYDFSVITSDILSQIYEQYLSKKIELASDYSISIVQEPEVVASNGVVPTPKRIVKQIVDETLDPLYKDSSILQTMHFKIADICCGSGTFLLAVFDYIIDYKEKYYLDSPIKFKSKLTQVADDQYRLSLSEKHDILINNIFGVDINPYAVEVARFSLLLRLIENENSISVQQFLDQQGDKVLPSLNSNIKCGNSLIDDSYYEFNQKAELDNSLLYRINTFNWNDEFPFLENSKGFHSIVGNPPYVRIQNFVKYSREEVDYYRSKFSPYGYSKKDLFDKYYLFIERATMLINQGGRIGYIIPHKFFIVQGGKKLRKVITSVTSLERIIHFGVTQLFPNRSTYVAIIVLIKKQTEKLNFSRIDSLKSKDIFITTPIIEYNNDKFGASPWVFVSEHANKIFEKLYTVPTTPLKTIAEIPVGLQTSADSIYIFYKEDETETHYQFIKDGKVFKIEKAICRPSIYDVSFKSFEKIEANTYMIFPYEVLDNSLRILSEDELSNNFPACWKYLNTYKSKLSKRSINGRETKWYQYGRNQSLTKFHNTKKIVFPVLSRGANYTIDETNFQFTGGGNGPYYAILSNSEYSVYYLAGVLSHPVLEAMVKVRASEFRGKYYSHGKQFIENLPIRAIDFNNDSDKSRYQLVCENIKLIMDTKSELKKQQNNKKQMVLRRKLDRLQLKLIETINSLYGLEKKDITEITKNSLFAAPIES